MNGDQNFDDITSAEDLNRIFKENERIQDFVCYRIFPETQMSTEELKSWTDDVLKFVSSVEEQYGHIWHQECFTLQAFSSSNSICNHCFCGGRTIFGDNL